MDHKEKILVTGANGFIGGWLAETLYLNGSTDVRAGIRSWSRAVRPARFPMDIVLCDILDKQQITQAMAGMTCVIHCAKGSNKSIIEGTRNMLDVSLDTGIRHFIFLSTAEVYGNAWGEIDENSPTPYIGNPYGDSKIEAENLCWQYHEKGLPVTIFRPSIVYGPFGREWIFRLSGNLLAGSWGTCEGYGVGFCNSVYITDLVSGILLAVENTKAFGEAFNLNGPELITWNDYFLKFSTALGQPKPKSLAPIRAKLRTTIMEVVRPPAKFLLANFESPLKIAANKSRLARRIMESFEKKIKTTPRPGELSLYNRNAVYVDTKARNLLGYAPKMDINRGLELSVCWLKHLGLDQFSTTGGRGI